MLLEVHGRLAFVATGDRSFEAAHPTLVFIHGAQHDHFVWQRLVARFAAPGRNILAVDLPGHGRSAGPALTSIEALAEWLLALLEKVGAGGTAPCLLAGHSMGSLIALETAARLGPQVRHLYLLGTALPMAVAPALLAAARDDLPRALALINRWSHSPLAERGAAGNLGLWLPALNLRLMERQPPASLHTDLSACANYPGGPAALRRLACPVTIVAGASDRMTSPRAAARLAAQLPAARLILLPAVGHAMLSEAPQAVGDVLAATFTTQPPLPV